jgi:predicted negative regulator of RcsB-dependent stress response
VCGRRPMTGRFTCMNKAERERLKHNETADAIAATTVFVAAHGRTLALGAVAVVLLIGVVVGYGAWKARAEERAQALLQAAIDTAAQPVEAPAAGAAPAEGTFATEADRTNAVIDKLRAVADSHPSTEAGLQARYYAASLLAEANRLEEAAAAYQAVVSQGGSSITGRMARLGLASVQVRSKDFESAITTFQSLSAPGSELPADGVLMHLADAYVQAGRPAEAIETLKRIVNEFPQSPYASEARQRADALQVDVPKAS